LGEIKTTLDAAMHAHRSGMPDEAEKLYRAVLSRTKINSSRCIFLA
jgi:hypothetical protein